MICRKHFVISKLRVTIGVLFAVVVPCLFVGTAAGQAALLGPAGIVLWNGNEPQILFAQAVAWASFLTVSHLTWGVVGLVTVLLASLAWIGALRRQVQNQTEVIRQRLEERRHFAESLAREKQLLTTLIDQLPDNVFVKDKEGRYTLTNRNHALFHGAANKEEFLGKTCFEIFPPELAQGYSDHDEAILSGSREVISVEIPSKDGRGNTRWLSSKKVPLKDSTGDIVGLVGISRDVTDQKRAEAALAHERDFLATLLDNLPDSIYFKDLQSRFVRVSKSKLKSSFELALSAHLASCKGPETGNLPPHLKDMDEFSKYLIGRTDFDFYAEERAHEAYEDEQKIIRTGSPVIGKIIHGMRVDGKVNWSLTTKMPWYDADGQIIGTFGISKDITPIKEAEAQVEQLHKQLLDTSHQAGMADVATNVLHNVGNVLNSVNVAVSLIVDGVKKSKATNFARVVGLMREHESDLGDFISRDPKGQQVPGYLAQLAEHLAAEQAATLKELEGLTSNIEHIKEIVAMQQNYARVSGVMEAVQVSELVEDALRMNAGALARHDVIVVREYGEALPKITVEKHKVLQILINLVRNAKYACDESDQPDKRITVRVANGEGRVKIAVTDNGVGIPQENMTRIFNHGFTTRDNGHGFGLHSGALAARELGGRLLAESDGIGRGATFTLELPVAPKSK